MTGDNRSSLQGVVPRRTPWSEALASARPLFGTFLQFPSAPLIEIIGRTGFDFVVLDLEHAEFGLSELPDLQRATELAGLYSVVRVPPHEPLFIGKALDYGADAVLVPHIDTAVHAARAVEAAKYPPNGKRGVYPVMRGAGYGLDYGPGWEAEENSATSVILLIESAAGLENLAEIARVPGVSGLFLGPMDLSHSLGIPGEIRHPRIEAAARGVRDAAREAGLFSSLFCGDADAAAHYLSQGFRLITYSADALLITQAYRTAFAQLLDRTVEYR